MRLAAGNGADAEVRQLLPDATLQLADRHGNAVAEARVVMAARLAWPSRASQRRSQPAPSGAELPVLQQSHADACVSICPPPPPYTSAVFSQRFIIFTMMGCQGTANVPALIISKASIMQMQKTLVYAVSCMIFWLVLQMIESFCHESLLASCAYDWRELL